jgi:hypothetical protein
MQSHSSPSIARTNFCSGDGAVVPHRLCRVISTMVMERPNISSMDEVVSGRFAIERKPYGPRGSVRIVSWNIECGLQFSGILDFLRTAHADLILLQEVDLSARRTQHRDVALELAQSLGLNYTFGKEFQELGAGSKASPAYHGMATLSPWPLSGGRIITF